MYFKRKFPNSRLRRMRLNSNLRDLLAEVRLSTNYLIQPLFIKEGLSGKEAIESMPNINRYGQDSIFSEIEELIEHDINKIADRKSVV